MQEFIKLVGLLYLIVFYPALSLYYLRKYQGKKAAVFISCAAIGAIGLYLMYEPMISAFANGAGWFKAMGKQGDMYEFTLQDLGVTMWFTGIIVQTRAKKKLDAKMTERRTFIRIVNSTAIQI